MRSFALLLLLAAAPPPPPVVVSPAPRDIAVTVYRNPQRGGDEIELTNLQGFALITERREVDIPAGPAIIRFEGVAGNILPESAVVGGLPAGAREKNMDADLLSPRTLYDRMLGRRVLVRRTDRATGRVVVEQAVIRSSAAGAAVVQLRGGTEALGCSGLPEQIIYPAVPAGLSPRPTLSIRTDAPRAVRAVLTLSYLAGGFDWQADYTLLLRPDGRMGDLFAWVTLASTDVTSFPGAATAVVAGKLNRVERTADDRAQPDGELRLRCWPINPSYATVPPPPPPPPMAVPAPMAAMRAEAMDIVVTASRVARQEELGDLKLYRFPDRVTVAAQAQKQVALLHRPAVATRIVYRQEVSGSDAGDMRIAVAMRNRVADGLGAPLPAGRVAVFQPAGDRRVLLDTVSLDDKAVGEKVELLLPAGPGVRGAVESRGERGRSERYRLIVTNANPWPVAYEARLRVADEQRLAIRAGSIVTEDGRKVWAVTVPANGTLTLDYAVEDAGD